MKAMGNPYHEVHSPQDKRALPIMLAAPVRKDMFQIKQYLVSFLSAADPDSGSA